MPEPNITVNGVRLDDSQAMAVRNAIAGYAATVLADGLGDDAQGRAVAKLYLDRLAEVQRLIARGAGTPIESLEFPRTVETRLRNLLRGLKVRTAEELRELGLEGLQRRADEKKRRLGIPGSGQLNLGAKSLAALRLTVPGFV